MNRKTWIYFYLTFVRGLVMIANNYNAISTVEAKPMNTRKSMVAENRTSLVIELH